MWTVHKDQEITRPSGGFQGTGGGAWWKLNGSYGT